MYTAAAGPPTHWYVVPPDAVSVTGFRRQTVSALAVITAVGVGITVTNILSVPEQLPEVIVT